MIFNKFIDKTLEAAKQSAQQIYGDDYSQLKDIIPNDDEQSERRHFSQDRKQNREESQNHQPVNNEARKQGVVFERSTPPTSLPETNSNDTLDKKLESIRKYAARQTDENIKPVDRPDSNEETEPVNNQDEKGKTPEPVNGVYSRRDIRSTSEKTKSSSDSQKKKNGNPLYDRLVENLPNGISKTPAKNGNYQKQQEKCFEDLHKRIDRLESLIHLSLSLPDTAFSDHPLFHKLLHIGVPQKLVQRWFEAIAQQDINPEQNPELFYKKLLNTIDEFLRPAQAGKTAKILLFTGRSGTGKTHLIMKLTSQRIFMREQNVAILSFIPDAGRAKSKYSMLQPFCEDHDIDFFNITNSGKIGSKQWQEYDHILIDTPAMEMGGMLLADKITDLRNKMQSHGKLETHHLINTAVSGTAFNDPLAKEIEADHIALTHIDQSVKWGKAIQLIGNSDYKLRYISSGPSITGDLLPFDSQKFARKLLRT